MYDILEKTGFYSMKNSKGQNSVKMKDAINDLPKAIEKLRNSSLYIQSDENEESVEIILKI